MEERGRREAEEEVTIAERDGTLLALKMEEGYHSTWEVGNKQTNPKAKGAMRSKKGRQIQLEFHRALLRGAYLQSLSWVAPGLKDLHSRVYMQDRHFCA